MKTVKNINAILDDVTITPTFKKFVRYSEEIHKYINENELFNFEKRQTFMKHHYAFHSKISLFYSKWSHFVLDWLLNHNNPCIIRFVSYHRYISKLKHRRTSTEYLHLPFRMYIDGIICAFKTLAERYDLGIDRSDRSEEYVVYEGMWDFRYKNFINISPEFGIPTTIMLYDMYDQWHFENAFQSCVQNNLEQMLT